MFTFTLQKIDTMNFMKVTTLFSFIIGMLTGCQNKIIDKPITAAMQDRPGIHSFKVEDIRGNEFDFSTLKGKKIMVVNTASKCGLTPQYKELQEIYERYKEDHFIIVGFPANDFMSQEPGSNDEIAEFCQVNYGVTFPMMAKITVTGKDKHPIYQFLTEEAKNGYADSKVEWNFQKYLINENGQLEKVVGPRIKPNDREILDWIEQKG